jgi:hypothetical protein
MKIAFTKLCYDVPWVVSLCWIEAQIRPMSMETIVGKLFSMLFPWGSLKFKILHYLASNNLNDRVIGKLKNASINSLGWDGVVVGNFGDSCKLFVIF